MKENYERTLKFIMKWEGATFHFVKGDRGGATSAYGLTLKTMQTLKIDVDSDGDVDMEDLKLVNKEIMDKAFKKHFWDKIKGDLLPGGIDLILADVSWNSSPGKVAQFIKEGFGDNIERLTNRRILFYENIVKADITQEKFLKGWKNRANDAKTEALLCFK
jgi:lysozyme family protein